MAKNNSFLSSDDELLEAPTIEPTAYEFQSDVSDDDDDDDANEEGNGDQHLPPQADSETDPIVLENSPEPVRSSVSAAPGAAPEKPAIEDFEDEIATETVTRDSFVSWTSRFSNGARNRVKVVDIEVPIPWLPPAQRSKFVYMKVDDEDYYMTRRRNYEVSRIFLARQQARCALPRFPSPYSRRRMPQAKNVVHCSAGAKIMARGLGNSVPSTDRAHRSV
ncbi:hypothetical protein B0T22DRAFT_465755 [Podospora appendiculata]|uniref:Uncharacterized protein n=1 Tax=Podospora appendiculata TaxID=314037 RepID=A0AAE1CAF1_9PEZI|nr:hypothetical protein B0T22DRAFT_465755 [Podospora appendiculata]